MSAPNSVVPLISIVEAEVSVVELKEELCSVKNALTGVQNNLDLRNQELHDCKRQLKVAEALEQEFQQEIESLQCEIKTGNEKHKSKLNQVETELADLKRESNETVQYLEAELSVKNEEIKELQGEMKSLSELATTQPTNELDKLKEENANLKLDIETLIVNQDELNEKCAVLQRQNAIFEEETAAQRREIENLEENVNAKRGELSEANNLITTLQDDLAMMRCEIESLRSKPLDQGSKGNSLFAEVDDRRLQLQKNVQSMRTKYVDMKREYSNLMKQIASLRSENIRLCQRWESEVNERGKEDLRILNSYKTRNEELQFLIANYQKEVAERQKLNSTGLSVGELNFVESILDEKRKEIEELRQKLISQSLTETILSMKLKEVGAELRSWQMKATQFEQELGNLRDNAQQKSLDVLFGNLVAETSAGNREDINYNVVKNSTLEKNLSDDVKVKECKHNIDYSRLSQRNKNSAVGFIVDDIFEKNDNNENEVKDDVAVVIKTEAKENEDPEEKQLAAKKVTFSESTVGSNQPQKLVPRRGGRILESKPIFISSLPKK